MKFRNTVKAFVPIGPRESCPPYGVTRDFTADEVEKSPEIRNAKDRGYLVDWDGKSPVVEPPAPRKTAYTTAPDTQGGDVTRRQMATGKVVEYITANDVGTDDVQNADMSSGTIAAVPGVKPLDYIESGVNATTSPARAKWTNASDAFEAELTSETTGDADFEDDDTVADNEEPRPIADDAEDAIDKDYSQLLETQGNQGSSVRTTREIVETASATATAELASAVAVDYDNGESAEGVSKDTSEFLSQPFASKKWLISKTSDSSFLNEVVTTTKSENVRTLASQRLSEIDKA